MWTIDQALQYFAWFMALIQVIIGLYIVYLHPRELASQQAALVLLVFAAYSYGQGTLSGAASLQQAYGSTLLIAATDGARVPLILLTAIALLKPYWVRSTAASGRWITGTLRLIACIPFVLTLVDALRGAGKAGFYYTGLNPATYRSGFVEPYQFLQGELYPSLAILLNAVPGLLLLLFLGYCILIDRSQTRSRRLLAVFILIANLTGQISGMFIRGQIPFMVASLLAGAFILGALAYAAYRDLISEPANAQRWQPRGRASGSLTTRLTGVILIVAVPLMAAMGIFLTDQARRQLEQDAVVSLAASNRAALESVEVWLSFNLRALKNLTLDDNIIRMNSSEQAPVLRSFASTYPYIYLVSTTNLFGVNVARSDGGIIADYSGQKWFKEIAAGQPVSYQVTTPRIGAAPSLVVASPIRDASGKTVGVAMFATELEQLSRLVTQTSFLGSGDVFLVDDRDYLLTHTDPSIKSGAYYHDYPAIRLLRDGKIGLVSFTDGEGNAWRAQVNVLSNGWGIVVQQDEASLLAPIRAFRALGIIAMLVGAGALLLLVTPAMRQGLRPVRSLTDTAAAISGGDIARLAPIESQDELGVLAEAFNLMTAQMRDLISGLEARVSERTRDVERRALQLQVTSEVAREAAAIREPEKLLTDVTRLISERLGHYHVGVFLIEGRRAESDTRLEQETGYAVLKAANSEGGQQMLKRGHRLKVGQVGIVGYVASAGRPRIALDVGRDAIYFNNPDLPLTRSEVALPLKIQNQVIGILDVQSKRAQAFTEDDLSILQILADQVALAIENARLIAESRQTVNELENLYGMQLAQGWQRRLGQQPLRYRLDPMGVHPEENRDEANQSQPADQWVNTPAEIEVPIELRGHKLGRLHLKRAQQAGAWTSPERELLQMTVAQLAQSLENARLLEEIQNRARQEEKINQIVARTQSSLNLDAVMRTAVQELAQALNVSKVRLRLGEEVEGEELSQPSDHPAGAPVGAPVGTSEGSDDQVPEQEGAQP